MCQSPPCSMTLSWSGFIFVPRIFPQPTIWTMTSHLMIDWSSVITPCLFSTSLESHPLCSPSPLHPSHLLSSLQCSLLSQVFDQLHLPSRTLFGQVWSPRLSPHPCSPLVFLSSTSPMSSHSCLWSIKIKIKIKNYGFQ